MGRQRILVTGAAGYIGRHVVASLLERGEDVVAMVRPGSAARVDPRASIVTGDVLDPDLDVAATVGIRPDSVVHLAWEDGFSHNAPSHLLRLSDHFRFLTAMADWGVKRITALGTMHEVGYWEGPIDAATPTKPLSLYGVAKDALRSALLLGLGDRVEVQWLRCFYIYGDDRRNQSVFTRLLETADRGETLFPFTSGKNKFDFIEVSELGGQIAAVATAAELTGIINCCTGEPVSLRDKVQEFIVSHGLDIALDFGAFPDRPYDSPGVWGDATTIRTVLADAR